MCAVELQPEEDVAGAKLSVQGMWHPRVSGVQQHVSSVRVHGSILLHRLSPQPDVDHSGACAGRLGLQAVPGVCGGLSPAGGYLVQSVVSHFYDRSVVI